MTNQIHPPVSIDFTSGRVIWRSLWMAAIAGCAAVLMGACGGGSGNAVVTANPPAAVVARAPVLEPGSAAIASVGGAGGRITAIASSGIAYTLIIPPGALTGDVTITLTPILDMGSAPLAQSVLGAVQMEPSGLKFQVPATLHISAAPALLADQKLVGFSTANDGGGFRLNLARLDGNSTLVNITHFSTGGAAGATPAQLVPLAPLAPTLVNADDAIAQLAELTARDAGMVQIVDVFRQWYVEIVKPALAAADGSTDVVFSVDAIIAYRTWISTMDYVADRNTLELALAAELAESASIAKRVFTAFINSNLDNCVRPAITMEARLASLSFASTLQGIAQSIGLAGAGSGLDRATFLLRANNCLRPVLDPITLPMGLKIGTGKSLDAWAQVIVSGQPNPEAAPFFFTVNATGASLGHSNGNSDADGRFTTVFTPSQTQMQFNVKACLVFQTGQPASDICANQIVSGVVLPVDGIFRGNVTFEQHMQISVNTPEDPRQVWGTSSDTFRVSVSATVSIDPNKLQIQVVPSNKSASFSHIKSANQFIPSNCTHQIANTSQTGSSQFLLPQESMFFFRFTDPTNYQFGTDNIIGPTLTTGPITEEGFGPCTFGPTTRQVNIVTARRSYLLERIEGVGSVVTNSDGTKTISGAITKNETVELSPGVTQTVSYTLTWNFTAL